MGEGETARHPRATLSGDECHFARPQSDGGDGPSGRSGAGFRHRAMIAGPGSPFNQRGRSFLQIRCSCSNRTQRGQFVVAESAAQPCREAGLPGAAGDARTAKRSRRPSLDPRVETVASEELPRRPDRRPEWSPESGGSPKSSCAYRTPARSTRERRGRETPAGRRPRRDGRERRRAARLRGRSPGRR
jgi:hypothetical protein